MRRSIGRGCGSLRILTLEWNFVMVISVRPPSLNRNTSLIIISSLLTLFLPSFAPFLPSLALFTPRSNPSSPHPHSSSPRSYSSSPRLSSAPLSDFNTLSATIPPPFHLSVPLLKYWDGQPVTYVCRKRSQHPVSKEGIYWSVAFEIVDEDAKRSLESRGGKAVGPTDEEGLDGKAGKSDVEVEEVDEEKKKKTEAGAGKAVVPDDKVDSRDEKDLADDVD